MDPSVHRALQQMGGIDPSAIQVIRQRRQRVLGRGIESIWSPRGGCDRQRRGILGRVRGVADEARDNPPLGLERSPAGGRPGGEDGSDHETVFT